MAKLRRFLVLILVIVLIATISWAAPSISKVEGTYAPGQTVKITGSSFGTKTNANPLRWDTMEDGTDGSSIVGEAPSALSYDSANWTGSPDDADHTAPRYSTAQKHSGNQGLYHNYIDGYGSYLGYTFTARQGQVYIALWEQVNYSSGMTNYKTLRQYGNGPGNNPCINTICGLVENGCWAWAFRDDNASSQEFGGGPGLPTSGVWRRVEYWYSTGTPGNADGFFRWYINGILVKSYTYQFLSSGSTYGWNNMRIQDYWSSATGLAQIYTDDVYIDNTPARVFISDANNLNSSWPNISSAHHSEIQIPTSWSASEIQFMLNQGSFADASTVYLYVVDADGAISEPQEITLGSSGTPALQPTMQGCSLQGGGN